MFEITGMYKGEVVEKKTLTGQQLLDFFQIKFPEGDTVVFNANLANKSIAGKGEKGKVKTAISRRYSTLINSFYNGSQYLIRYYHSKMPKPKGNGYNYKPIRVTMDGRRTTLNKKTDFEKCVFLALQSSCGDSPFSNPNNIEYTILDFEQQQKKNFEAKKLIHEQRSAIYKMDETTVLDYAFGVEFQDGPTTVLINTDSLSSKEGAVDELIKLVDRYPHKTLKAISDRATYVQGVIKHLEHKGFISFDPKKSSWVYREGGGTILTINKGSDPYKQLVFNMKNESRLNELIASTRGGETNTSLGIDSVASRSVPQMAIDQKAVGFYMNEGSTTEGKVYILDSRGMRTGKALIGNVTQENWKGKVLELESGPQYNRLKKAIADGSVD